MDRAATIGFLPLVLGLCPGAFAAEEMDGRRFYFGELHAHTGMSLDGGSADLGGCESGGCGNAADFFDTARGPAGLDFAAITDHINGQWALTEDDWAYTITLAEAGHDPDGGFVALLGGEMEIGLADGVDLGHRNYLFFADPQAVAAVDLADLTGVNEEDGCEELWEAVRALDDEIGPLLFVPHHPAAVLPMATRWWCHDELLAPVVELYSSHGNSRDTPERDDYDPLFFGHVNGSAVNEALAPDREGLHLGFVGGTDFHDSWPGMICHLDQVHADQRYGGSLTGVFLDAAEPFERTSLHDALLHRHALTTTGPRTPVLLSALDEDGNVLAVSGDVLSPPPAGRVFLRVTLSEELAAHVIDVSLYDATRATVPMEELAPGVHELELGEFDLPWFGYATVRVDGGSWWADQGVPCVDGGDDQEERIWTSPIWIEEIDDVDDDGDGYSELEGDCDDMVPTIHPDADELPNYRDDDCDGEVDEGTELHDGDGDGYSPAEGDCDDQEPAAHPDAEPACDGIVDNDCDGAPDADEVDGDGDGVTPCDGDCDDGDAGVFPGAAERDNGVDDNCDGVVDEDAGEHEMEGDPDHDTDCECGLASGRTGGLGLTAFVCLLILGSARRLRRHGRNR